MNQPVTCLRYTEPASMLVASMPTVGANIKAARLAAGITVQGELAEKMGVPQPQLRALVKFEPSMNNYT